MVYFDNAATSRPKPEVVTAAFMEYVQRIGTSPGRGSYSLGISASRMLYQSRKAVTNFFGCSQKTNVVFTKNSTEAINLFLNGYLQPGDHVLISPFEHNAVLRPLHYLSLYNGIKYDVLPEAAIHDVDEFKKALLPNTRLVCITLASNLTGEIIYNRALGRTCALCHIPVFVDASQGGGKMLVKMQNDYIDYLAFTGHKDLLCLPGVGGLCSNAPLRIRPLIQGGTGIHGEEYVNPDIYPEAYESGTLNMPAIWALKTSIEYIKENHLNITKKENDLLHHLINGLREIKNVKVIRPEVNRVPTICFNVHGKASSDVVAFLDKNGICARGGIHCAILAHQTIGTVKTGAVRISLNYNNTHEEIDFLLDVLREMK